MKCPSPLLGGSGHYKYAKVDYTKSIKQSQVGIRIEFGLILPISLTKKHPHSNIEAARRGSSVVEQGTHKPLVVGSTPTLGTENPYFVPLGAHK